jgi:hypothetical protein
MNEAIERQQEHCRMQAMLFGMKVIEDVFLSDRKQVRFPRSKKVRIRRKWAKQAKNYDFVPKSYVYQVGDKLLGHPETIRRIAKVDADFAKATVWNGEAIASGGITRESIVDALKLMPKLPKEPDLFSRSSMFAIPYFDPMTSWSKS